MTKIRNLLQTWENYKNSCEKENNGEQSFTLFCEAIEYYCPAGKAEGIVTSVGNEITRRHNQYIESTFDEFVAMMEDMGYF